MVISKEMKGPYSVSLLRVHLWAVINMFQGGMWIFAATNPAVVGIDLPLT
jgi:hypothetical protein